MTQKVNAKETEKLASNRNCRMRLAEYGNCGRKNCATYNWSIRDN
jgi:hypothetical protein